MFLSTLILLLALVAFLAAAVGLRVGNVNLIAAGLALWVLAQLV